jgi:hypothetical protein
MAPTFQHGMKWTKALPMVFRALEESDKSIFGWRVLWFWLKILFLRTGRTPSRAHFLPHCLLSDVLSEGLQQVIFHPTSQAGLAAFHLWLIPLVPYRVQVWMLITLCGPSVDQPPAGPREGKWHIMALILPEDSGHHRRPQWLSHSGSSLLALLFSWNIRKKWLLHLRHYPNARPWCGYSPPQFSPLASICLCISIPAFKPVINPGSVHWLRKYCPHAPECPCHGSLGPLGAQCRP